MLILLTERYTSNCVTERKLVLFLINNHYIADLQKSHLGDNVQVSMEDGSKYTKQNKKKKKKKKKKKIRDDSDYYHY